MRIVNILTVFVLAATLGMSSMFAKTKIGVTEFRAGVENTDASVTGLSDMLVSELVNSYEFDVIERTMVSSIEKELGFVKGKPLTNAQIAALGKRLKVDLLVVGTVNFQTRSRNPYTNINSGEYNIDARMVDVSSGRIIASAGGTQNSLQTTRQLIKNLAAQLINSYHDNYYSTDETKLTSPVTILGYLTVYPTDLGKFESSPTQIINKLNRQAMYGINDWRLPTNDELDIIKSNASKLGINPRNTYATSTSTFMAGSPKIVRLVSAKAVERVNIDDNVNVSLYPKSQNLGQQPILKNTVKTQFRVQNNSSRSLSIEKISCSSSNVTISYDSNRLLPESDVVVTLNIKLSGAVGQNIIRKIYVTLSNGETLTFKVSYSVI